MTASPDAILRMEETSERTSVTFIWTLELAADWLVVVACEPHHLGLAVLSEDARGDRGDEEQDA